MDNGLLFLKLIILVTFQSVKLANSHWGIAKIIHSKQTKL